MVFFFLLCLSLERKDITSFGNYKQSDGHGLETSRKLPNPSTFLCIFVQGQLIQIYSVDWTDVYDTHNIKQRTEPVNH